MGCDMLPDAWEYRPVSNFKHPTDQTVQTGPFGAQLHSDAYVDEGVPFVLIRNMVRGGVDDTNMPRISLKDAGRLSNYRLQLNDIVFSRVGRVGSCFLVEPQQVGWVISGQLLRLRLDLKELDPRFLIHWIRSPYVERSIGNESVGSTRQSINSTILGNMPVPSIPLPEQRQIGAILDTLDTAIYETEAIIAKLKAVKQGLLHDLLTRGIDANGELRPSQVEAPHLYKQSPLGWIPNAWDIATLEAVSTTVTSGSRDWARFYADSGALFVRIGNLTREHINFRFDSTIYVRPPRNADGQRTRLEPGDILISITADLGVVGVVPVGIGEAYINQHIALVRPSHGVVNPRFVGHYLASQVAQTYISKLNDAGAKAGLNLPTVRGLLTARPDRMEQNLIAERLDEIDNSIQNATTEAAKLRELKAGLMDDLLTGRVRVTPLLAEPERAKECA
jgi:type I restriction enzyme S subunit